LLAFCVSAPAGAASDEDVLARIAGDEVTVADLRDYARLNPFFFTQLQLPGGPKKVLDNLIAERLLVLEGEKRGFPRRTEKPGDDVPYAYAVRKRLVSPCPEPDADSVRAFYDQHTVRFATPLLLRLSRLVLPAGENPEAVIQRLEELKHRIEAREADMAALADELSVDPLGRGRGGDLGFQKADDTDPILRDLARLPVGALYGPVRQGVVVVVYQVTDRREPIPEPFESARERVLQEQLRQCNADAFARVLEGLKASWQVEIYAEEIGVFPVSTQRSDAPPGQ